MGLGEVTRGGSSELGGEFTDSFLGRWIIPVTVGQPFFCTSVLLGGLHTAFMSVVESRVTNVVAFRLRAACMYLSAL